MYSCVEKRERMEGMAKVGLNGPVGEKPFRRREYFGPRGKGEGCFKGRGRKGMLRGNDHAQSAVPVGGRATFTCRGGGGGESAEKERPVTEPERGCKRQEKKKVFIWQGTLKSPAEGGGKRQGGA